MDWLLFVQIEIILLTLGLVASFVVSMYQTAKDRIFANRMNAIGKTLNELGNYLEKYSTNHPTEKKEESK